MNCKYIILPSAIFLSLAAACSGNKGTTSEATAMLDQATASFEAADYQTAISLLDSLQKAYPSEIEVQRQALALRPKVIEKETLLKISTNDSLSALDKIEAEKLKPKMKWVKNPRMPEGYWTATEGYSADFMNSTGIQGRVSEIGEFFIVSSVKGGGVNHTSVSLADGQASVSTPEVAYDGESNYRIGGSEIITFSPAQSDTIGQFVFAHAGRPLTLTFNGKSRKSVKLTPAQVSGLADAYAYSKAINNGRQLAVERQRLEATLQVARNQIARTSQLQEEDDR